VLRIALTALSGSGKSTCAAELTRYAAERGLKVARVPLARPLYRLQDLVYDSAGVRLAAGAQDQELMEELARHLRRLNPGALAYDCLSRAEKAAADGADIIVNEDLRDPHVDAPALRSAGFRVLRITCAESARLGRLERRGDLTLADRSTSEIDLITPDAVLDNSVDLDSYRAAVRRLLGSWL
jgi:dephospho-CoA kinase